MGPTNTPSPTPPTCTIPRSQSLGSTTLSGNAGDTLNQTLTITNNNPIGCGQATYSISYSRSVGFTHLTLPPSVKLSGGQSITIPFTIYISTGAQVQNYTTQYMILGVTAGTTLTTTIHVLATAPPPQVQMFSNFGGKSYGNYATFEFSYNANGSSDARVDVATDPSALNQTSGINSAAQYGFAYTSGYAWDASTITTPTSIRGFINSSPQSWSRWQCGATIYWRIYDTGDPRIMSPIQSNVVDCTTAVNILPWSPWYDAIYRGVYDARYDTDTNNLIDWNDYWSLVRATRLR